MIGPVGQAVGIAVVVTASLVGVAYAQMPGGTITRVVTDASGARVADAGVSIANQQTGQSWTLTTSAEGIYSLPALLPGEYRVTLSAAGFKSTERDVTVEAGTTPAPGRAQTVNATESSGPSTLCSLRGWRVLEVMVGMRHLTLVLLFSLGCGDSRLPTQPTQSLPAPTPLELLLSGSVADTAFRSIGNVRVEVIAGSRTGTFTTTDSFGRFLMPGTFTDTVTIRASTDGYLPATTTLPPNRPVPPSLAPGEVSRWDVYLSLQPDGPSANLAGTYRLTLSTASACANFPDEARTRTYTATLAPGYRSTTFVGTVSDSRMVRSLYSPYFEINVAGDFARVTIGFVERLDETRYLAIDGGAAASVSPSGIAAPFNAAILHCPNEPVRTSGDYWSCGADAPGIECNSSNHQLALVRR